MARWHDTEAIMEQENNRLADQLASKVSRMKMISLDLKDDVEDDLSYLNETDNDFSSVTSLLGGSVNRFKKMVDSGRGNRKLMCYVVMFLVGTFFFLYFIFTRK